MPVERLGVLGGHSTGGGGGGYGKRGGGDGGLMEFGNNEVVWGVERL